MTPTRAWLIALVNERDRLEACLAKASQWNEAPSVLDATQALIARLNEQIGEAMEADRDA